MFSREQFFPDQADQPGDLSSLAVKSRPLLEADPVAILRIATAIGEGRGEWPASGVTELCTELVPRLENVDPEQVVEELTAVLLTRDVDSALEWLLQIGFVRARLGELGATKDLAQEGGRHHKDVWEHTKLVVKQAVRRPGVRWGALLHDIGKVPTRTFTNKGVHFHGHAEVGARMFDRMSKRIPLDKPLRRKVRFLIRHHLRAAQYEPSWTDSAVRRFDREMGEHLTDLLDLSRADITSKRPGRRKSLLKQITTLQDRIEGLRAEAAVLPSLLPGVGNDIMAHFELPPSRLIGEIKREIETAIAAGELEERRESAYYIEWLTAGDVVPRVRAAFEAKRKPSKQDS